MAGNDLIKSRADAAVLSRDFALATRLYNSLLSQSPNDILLLEKLGSIYVKSGDDKKALECYSKVNKLKPNDFETLNSLGGIYRRLKMYDESINVLKEALNLNINIAEVNYNLGFTYKFMEKYDDAVECFETVIQMNPDDVLAYNHLGSIHHKRGEYVQAVQTYLKGLKVDCNHPILHLNLAKSYEKQNEIKNAIAEYEAALRSKPGWKDAIYDYVKLLIKLNQTAEAKELISQAISLNPRDEKMHTKKGEIALKQNDYVSAIEEYQSALRLDPSYKRALVGLAQSLEENGESASAIEYIEKAEKENPEDISLAKKSASISLSANRTVAASNKIKTLLDKDKDDVETLDLAGQFFIIKEQDLKAENCYKRIEQLDPAYVKYLFQASKRYKQKGNLEQAENYIKQYIAKSPKDSKALTNLALIAEALGKTNEALLNFRKALQIDKNNFFAKNALARISEYLTSSDSQENIFDDTLENSQEVQESGVEEDISVATNDSQFEQEEETTLVDEESSPTETDLWKSESWDPDSIVEEVDDPFAAMDEQDESILTGNQNDSSEPSLDELEDEIENEENKGCSVPPLESLVDSPRKSYEDDDNKKKSDSSDDLDEFGDEDFLSDLDDFDFEDKPNEEKSNDEKNDDTKDNSKNKFDDEKSDNQLDDLPDFDLPHENPQEKEKNQLPKYDDYKKPDFSQKDFEPDYEPELEPQESKKPQKNTPSYDDDLESAFDTTSDSGFDEEIERSANSDLFSTPDFDSEFEDFPESSFNQIPNQTQKPQEPVNQLPQNQDLQNQIPQMQLPKQTPPQQQPLSTSDAIHLMESVIKTQSEANRAIEAATKAQMAAEKAADSVQEAESSLTDMATREVMKAAEQLREQAEEIAKEATDKVIAEKMQILDDVIPSFEKMLSQKSENSQDSKLPEQDPQFKQALLLFQSLKALGQSLPDESRTEFMQSSNRLKIDYIISRLSGNEGLLKKSQELRDSGVLENFVKEAEVPLNFTGKKLAVRVLKDLVELSKNLTDEDLLVSVDRLILSVQDKLN